MNLPPTENARRFGPSRAGLPKTLWVSSTDLRDRLTRLASAIFVLTLPYFSLVPVIVQNGFERDLLLRPTSHITLRESRTAGMTRAYW